MAGVQAKVFPVCVDAPAFRDHRFQCRAAASAAFADANPPTVPLSCVPAFFKNCTSQSYLFITYIVASNQSAGRPGRNGEHALPAAARAVCAVVGRRVRPRTALRCSFRVYYASQSLFRHPPEQPSRHAGHPAPRPRHRGPVRRSSYHGASLEALLLWDASTALFEDKGAVSLRLDAAEAAAGRQDLLGRPYGAQSQALLRLTAAIPLFDVGAIYLGLMNEATLAALLENRSRAEWRAAASALAAAVTPGSSSGSEGGEAAGPRYTFSVRQQLGSLGLFASLETYPGSTAGLQAALAAAVQTLPILRPVLRLHQLASFGVLVDILLACITLPHLLVLFVTWAVKGLACCVFPQVVILSQRV